MVHVYVDVTELLQGKSLESAYDRLSPVISTETGLKSQNGWSLALARLT